MAVFQINVVIEDGKESTGSFFLYAPDTYTLADINAATPHIKLIIQNLITGAVTRIYLSYELGDYPSDAPDPDSDVEERAKFKWLCASTGHTPYTHILTFNEDFLYTSGQVDLGAAEVVALIGMMTDGDAAGVFFSDSRGVPITNFLEGEEQFRKRKKKRR
jgi:hypothetical protein